MDGRGNAVSLPATTRYYLFFIMCPDWLRGPPEPLISYNGRKISLGIKRRGSEADYKRQPCAEVLDCMEPKFQSPIAVITFCLIKQKCNFTYKLRKSFLCTVAPIGTPLPVGNKGGVTECC